MNDFVTAVQEKMEALGVISFGADLAAGRIQWMDGDGHAVAQGSCKAVLSYAAADQSYMWLSEMAHYATVPTLKMPSGRTAYNPETTEEEARALAALMAMLDGADYLYAAPTGPGSYAYLAVYSLRFVDDTGAPAVSPKVRDRMVLAHLRAKAELARDHVRGQELGMLVENLQMEMDWAVAQNLSPMMASVVVELANGLRQVDKADAGGVHRVLMNTRAALVRLGEDG